MRCRRKCEECHRSFWAKRSDAKFCKQRCREKAYERRLSVRKNGHKNLTVTTVHYAYNASLISACARLYIPDKAVVADVTFGLGHFWSKTSLSRFTLLASDIAPRDSSIRQMDFRELSYCDQSIDVVVLDPPYLHRTNATATENKHRFDRAYNNAATTGEMNHDQILKLYASGMSEAFRVLKPGGTLWVKCKDEVESGQRFSHIEVYLTAVNFRFRAQDLFVLVSNSIPTHKNWRGQQLHARKNHSFLWIFKRPEFSGMELINSPTYE